MSNDELELGIHELSSLNFHDIFFSNPKDLNDEDIFNDISIGCNYIDPDTFSIKFKNSKSCSLLSLNICGLNSKFIELLDLISFWNEKNCVPQIICLQEIFSISDPSLFKIPNYHEIIFKERKKFKGGGIAIFVHKSLKFSIVEEYSLFHEMIIESLFIEVEFKNKKKLLIGNYYRSPSRGLENIQPNQQMEMFLESFQTIVDCISDKNQKAILCGDFNLNLLNYDNHDITRDFANCLFSAGFLEIIKNPTRVSNYNNHNTATLIDHIWTNDLKEQMTGGIITTYLSDHFSTFYLLETNKHTPLPKNISKRDISDENIEKFKRELENLSFADVYKKNDAQSSFDTFQSIYNECMNTHFPIKTIRFNKNYHMGEKWMTRGILNSRKNKYLLLKEMSKNPTHLNKEKYKNYKNTYNKVLKTRKKLYYSQLLIEHQGDLKRCWNIIKEASGLSSNKNDLTDKLIIDGNNIFGEGRLCTEFNNHFSSISESIKESIPPTDKPPDSYLNESEFQFQLPKITTANILEIVNELENKKSSDYDGNSSFILKKIILSILDPLCFIFNKSLETGIVPSQFKIAKITPVFKAGGTQTNLNDYRPIALLLIFDKILEKFVANHLKYYLFTNNLIDPLQFGFQNYHSTIHPMIHLLNTVGEAINDNKYTVGIFCDIRKAFDVVPKRTLLMKLQKFGINGLTLKWFESYLSERKQFVKIGMSNSEMNEMTSGVAQGSILGPILFLIFINDLPKSTLLKLLLFCDDTTILASGKNLNELIEFVNFELSKICQWFRSNQLSLHPGKTKFTIFSPSPSLIPWNDINLYIDNNEPNTLTPDPNLIKKIDYVNHETSTPAIKFLGMHLDPALNFKFHINEVSKKLSKSLFCLRRCKNLLTEKALKSLYYSTFHSHLIYGIQIYSCANQTNLHPIILKQKKAIRCIKNARYNAHTGELFKNLKILPFGSLSSFFKLKFMYEYKNNLLPRSFNNLWNIRGVMNGDHLLRNNNEFTVPRFRLSLVERLPLCSIPDHWNKFNDINGVKNALTKKQFCKKLKEGMLDQISTVCVRLLCPSCHLRL